MFESVPVPNGTKRPRARSLARGTVQVPRARMRLQVQEGQPVEESPEEATPHGLEETLQDCPGTVNERGRLRPVPPETIIMHMSLSSLSH